MPLGVLLLVGCGGSASSTPLKPVADVKELMHAVLDPAADGVWASVSTIIDEKGTEERYPKTDEEWEGVRDASMALVESGNLLMLPGRPDGRQIDEEWIRLCEALMEVSMEAVKAADARNKDALFSIGGEIYAVCENCHQKYAPGVGRMSD
jgi:hypothetical protein